MDNDILRRWELTVWKKFWEANAILTWDLLNSLAFEVLSDIKNEWNYSVLMNYFWKAVGLNWMLWWQVLDLYYEKNPEELNLDNLIEIHNKKTWALIEISVLGWIFIAEGEVHFVKDKVLNNIKKYLDFWKKIWLAFQVKDDLLDVEWTTEETGKSVWWENKWFVHFMWIEKTKEYLNNLIIDSLNIISSLKSNKLNFLVSYIWNRKK
jgi:geranylgeranyl diphosphate synthase type II